MKQYKIKNEKDCISLIKEFDADTLFKCIETDEIFALANMLYNSDWNDFEKMTIEYMGGGA